MTLSKDSIKRTRLSKKPYSDDSPRNRHGLLSEANTMKRLGARATVASGSQEHSKSDGTLDVRSILRYRLENKATIKESISIKRAWLTKICKEALETGRTPAMTIQFTDADGMLKKDGNWVMLREQDFKELLEGTGE